MNSSDHYRPLDGVRACSILLALAAHLLPMGPKGSGLNHAVGLLGMVLFFMLSGFLVTTQLLLRPEVRVFLLRRSARILPLAWLYMAIALTFDRADPAMWSQQWFFYATLLPKLTLTPTTAHLWSLCLEVQFYALCALSVAIAGRRALYALPLLGVAVTLWRIHQGSYADSRTLLRADELFAGMLLALLWHAGPASPLRRWLAHVPMTAVAILLCASCWGEVFGALSYARPYLALLLVGACLAQPQRPVVRGLLSHPRLAYIATISYALYVIHPLLAHTWLGSGDTLERYLKRPLLFAVLIALAHLSTFHFERRFIDRARRATHRQKAPPRATSLPPQLERQP